MTLVEFLKARIAEDEDATRLAAAVEGGDLILAALPNALFAGVMLAAPKRVLAECDAKRRAVRMHAKCGTGTGYCDDGGHGWGGDDPLGCADLALLALPYRDHADYDPAWAPASGPQQETR